MPGHIPAAVFIVCPSDDNKVPGHPPEASASWKGEVLIISARQSMNCLYGIPGINTADCNCFFIRSFCYSYFKYSILLTDLSTVFFIISFSQRYLSGY